MNPFVTHRSKVLGSYATASWLRQAVLCMRSGTDYPLNLSRLGEIDEAHFTAFLEMLAHYRLHGENDVAFLTLVKDCLQHLDEKRQAEEHEERFEVWRREARGELRKLGLAPGEVDDRYSWFESQFNAGQTAAAAAMAVRSLPPL